MSLSQSILRSPRGFISINGIQVPWQSFEISNTRYSAASTFHVTLPSNALPITFPLNSFVNQAPLILQINAGIPSQVNANNATPSDVPMLILGDVDEVSYDPKATMITLLGRDYISRFIENKVLQQNGTTSFTGLPDGANTSSIIVTKIASNRGLIPIVTATTNPVGKYFQNQYTQLSSQITEWDLMTFLARQENYDIYASGLSLYFQPKTKNNPYNINISTPIGEIPTSNTEDIIFTRNLRLAKDIKVIVTTYNIANKTSYTATASLKHTAKSTSSTSQPSVYMFTFPNLTTQQCQDKASALLQQISQHEMAINITMPGDSVVTSHSQIVVSGTNTLFDQTYFVKNVTRKMDFINGYTMTIDAKNQSPYTVSVQ